MARRIGKRSLVPGALLLLALGCGESPSGGPGEPTELEGTWTGYELGGDAGWTFILTGNTFSTTGPGEWHTGTFSLNTGASPKQMNALITDSAISIYIGSTMLGIYQLSGDTLTIAAHEPGDPTRPTSFVPAGDERVWILTR